MSGAAVAAALTFTAATASAAQTITFVQVNSSNPRTPQSTVAVAFPSAQTAGNLNVIAIAWGDTTRSVVSVTDSRNNTYAPAIGLTRNTASTYGREGLRCNAVCPGGIDSGMPLGGPSDPALDERVARIRATMPRELSV